MQYRGMRFGEGMKGRGFTLIEIIFAVLTLSGGLIVLLGLQSSVTARSVDDAARQHAMLRAREILTAPELRREPLPITPFEGSVREVVEKILPNLSPPQSSDSTDGNSRFQVVLSIEPWGFTLPGVPLPLDDVMRRVTLLIRWGSTPRTVYEITYFISKEDDDDPV